MHSRATHMRSSSLLVTSWVSAVGLTETQSHTCPASPGSTSKMHLQCWHSHEPSHHSNAPLRSHTHTRVSKGGHITTFAWCAHSGHGRSSVAGWGGPSSLWKVSNGGLPLSVDTNSCAAKTVLIGPRAASSWRWRQRWCVWCVECTLRSHVWQSTPSEGMRVKPFVLVRPSARSLRQSLQMTTPCKPVDRHI